MAKRTPNQNQTQFCLLCGRDTVHKAYAGPKSSYRDESGLVKVPAPFQDEKMMVYRRVKECTVCAGNSITIEISADTYASMIGELKSLRALKASIKDFVLK